MDVGNVQAGYNRKRLIDTVVSLTSGEENLGVKWINRQLAHGTADLCKIAFIIKCAQVVKLLKGAHQRLRCRRVHVIKVHDIVNAEFLEV